MSGLYEELYVKIDSKAYWKNGEVIVKSDALTPEMILGTTGRGPKGSFEILRVKPFCEILDRLNVPMLKVMSFLIREKNTENCVDISVNEIAESVGVSKGTVIRSIDKMEKAGLVVQGFRKYMINPSIIHKGNRTREGYLYLRYEEMAKKYGKLLNKDIVRKDSEKNS